MFQVDFLKLLGHYRKKIMNSIDRQKHLRKFVRCCNLKQLRMCRPTVEQWQQNCINGRSHEILIGSWRDPHGSLRSPCNWVGFHPLTGQISIIPKPELRGFWGDSLTKPPFKVTSVVIICPDIYIYIYNIQQINRVNCSVQRELQQKNPTHNKKNRHFLALPFNIPGTLGWPGCFDWKTSWWFQPIWKILVKLDHFPRDRGETKKYFKPPPRKDLVLEASKPPKIEDKHGRVPGLWIFLQLRWRGFWWLVRWCTSKR